MNSKVIVNYCIGTFKYLLSLPLSHLMHHFYETNESNSMIAKRERERKLKVDELQHRLFLFKSRFVNVLHCKRILH